MKKPQPWLWYRHYFLWAAQVIKTASSFYVFFPYIWFFQIKELLPDVFLIFVTDEDSKELHFFLWFTF